MSFNMTEIVFDQVLNVVSPLITAKIRVSLWLGVVDVNVIQ